MEREDINVLFKDMKIMIKGLNKKKYERNTDAFRKEHGEFFKILIESVENSDTPEKEMDETAAFFVESVIKLFSVKGKIAAVTKIDLNCFMVYYVFPTILFTQSPVSEKIADAILRQWKTKFKNSNMSFTTYDKIHDSFNEKIFGIF